MQSARTRTRRTPHAARPGRGPGLLCVVAALLAASAVMGCGSASGPPTLAPSGPWRAELAAVFDDTVDFVSPLRSILGTPWFDEYGAQLERRLAEADVVAVVAVRMVLPADSDQVVGTIEVEVEETFRGDVARGTLLRLDLPAARTARFAAEREHIEDLVRFVAYVRLWADETGAVHNHWHLSPRDDDLLGTIRHGLQPPAE